MSRTLTTSTPAEDAEAGLAITIPDPVRDGSAALAHDGYDVQVWHEAQRDYPQLATAVSKAAGRIVTAPALLRDLFLSFYQRVPQATPPVPLTPAYAVNGEILAQVLATVEWQSLRAAGTIDDPLAAAMGTIGVATRTLAALDTATVERINRLHELESGAADLWAQADALTDLAQQAQGDRAAARNQPRRRPRPDRY